jgi:phage tail tube protein FII
MNNKIFELAEKHLRGELTEVQLGFWKQTLHITQKDWETAIDAVQQPVDGTANVFWALGILAVIIFVLIRLFN